MSNATDPKYGQGYVIGINYIPDVTENWPNNAAKGYVCGTIPYDNAPCLANAPAWQQGGRYNIDPYRPSTFISCCNGPIINITETVIDRDDPSYGATCLAYCPVDFSRSLDIPGDFGFGDYWNCITNQTSDPFVSGTDSNGNAIHGSITCGWIDTSEHDKCEISISAERTNTATTLVTMYPASQLNWSSPTTALAVSKTYASCPPQTTSRVYSSSSSSVASPTPAGSSGSHLEPPKVGVRSVVRLILIISTLFTII